MDAEVESTGGTLHLKVALVFAGLAMLALGSGFAYLFLEAGSAALDSLFRDDAYYCFDWARSVVEGRGPRVGGGAPTSGVHLLWELVLMIPALAGRRAVELSAPPIGALAVLLAAFVLGRSLRDAGGGRYVPWITGLLLLGNSLVGLEACNGQETGLGALAMAWVLHEARASRFRFTFAAVLAIFARSDLFLFVAALTLQRPGTWWVRSLGPAVALLLYAAVNFALTGRPLQDSAEPMAWLFHQRFEATDPDWTAWLRTLWWWGRPVAFGSPFVLASAVGTACLLAVPFRALFERLRFSSVAAVLGTTAMVGLGGDDLLIPCLAIVLALLPQASTRVGLTLRDVVGPLGGAVALVALHSLIRWYPRDYYWVPIAVVGTWAIGRTLAGGGPRGVAAAVAIVAIPAGSFLAAIEGRFAPWDAHLRESEHALDAAARHLESLVPEVLGEGERIGAFNSGHLTWRLGDRVVNLDGVVNRPAFEALRAGRISAWLDEQAIGWLCDNPQQFSLDPTVPHACGAWFGSGFDPAEDLEEWARFVDADPESTDRRGTETVALYRRGGGRERPERGLRLDWLEHSRGFGAETLVWVGRTGEELVREVSYAADEPPQTLARAIPGVPLAIILRPPTRPGSSSRIYVRGREEAMLHQYGPR